MNNIYQKEFASFVQPLAMLNPDKARKVIVCGLIHTIRHVMTKRGKKLTILSLEDDTGQQDVVVFSEVYSMYQSHVIQGVILFVEGELARDDYNQGIKVTANALYGVAQARSRFAKCLTLTLTPDHRDLLPGIQTGAQGRLCPR